MDTLGARAATAAAAKAAPRPTQTAAELQNAIADAAGLQPNVIKRFLEALRDVAAMRLRETNKFKLDSMVVINMKQTPRRKKVTRTMFGKEVVLKAKPAGQKITAKATKQFYDAVRGD